jgi:membrane-bound serine protease (ClpP class)
MSWTPAALRPAVLRLLALLLLLVPVAHAAAATHITVLALDTTIQPISEEYLNRGLALAAQQHSDAVLIELNTPGGLLTSTRSMVRSILDSPVPVIVYVAPSGARAGSAGFFLLEAADVAAMAPGTNAGASHPVQGNGQNIDSTMKQKVENDTTAFLRSYTARRHRNVGAAQAAVLESKSYSADEALQLHLIDLVAGDPDALLLALNNRSITRFNGQLATLHTAGATLTPVSRTARERLLGALIDPDIALLTIVAGAFLIYLEFNTPGTIIPGALGTLLVLTSLFALNLLPLRLTSVMLLIAAAALLLLEIKAPSHGVLAGTGIVCLVLGALTLVAGPIPEQRVHFATALGAGTGFGVVTVFLVRIALRARRNKVVTGASAMVGALGTVQEPFELGPTGLDGGAAPRGQILVRGEIWFAQAEARLTPGDRVRVVGVRGLTLLVERVPTAP